MEEHLLTSWIYALAAVLLSVSLYAKNWGYYAYRRALIRIIPYFFSFAPVGMLIYCLYMVSHMY